MAPDKKKESPTTDEASLLFEQLLQYADDLSDSYGREKARLEELEAAYEKLKAENKARQKTEHALRESEERFRTLFESVRDCVFIKDRSLKYTHVNAYMQNLLNLDQSEILNRSDADLFGPDAGAHLHEVDTRVLSGEVVEEQHTRKIHGISFTFLDVRAPMRNASGEIVGICGIAHNITGREPIRPPIVSEQEEYPSVAMQSTIAAARMASQTDSIVLLTGESGCGKDYLARFIHDQSKRSNGPFFAVNCASIPAEIAESELFGHEPGAFTGAHRRVRGLFELAEGGTLLLNEIGELPLQLQAKLLAFLDTRSFTRVGGRHTVRINARLIAATNKNLQTEVSNGTFRADLFYRLNVLSIHVPPLRERKEDLPLLVDRLVLELSADLQLPEIPQFEPKFIKGLAEYQWPGNVRELRNVLERQLIISGESDIAWSGPEAGKSEEPGWSVKVPFPHSLTLDDVVADVVREIIEEALHRSEGRVQEAADMLGISRHTLRRRMKAVGLLGNQARSVHPKSRN